MAYIAYPMDLFEENGIVYIISLIVGNVFSMKKLSALNDMLELSVNGTISPLRLELGRYEGKPIDFLEISGGVTAKKALELENLIQHLPPDHQVALDKLGRYQLGLVER